MRAFPVIWRNVHPKNHASFHASSPTMFDETPRVWIVLFDPEGPAALPQALRSLATAMIFCGPFTTPFVR